jgi:hypothetical protein
VREDNRDDCGVRPAATHQAEDYAPRDPRSVLAGQRRRHD